MRIGFWFIDLFGRYDPSITFNIRWHVIEIL